MSYVYAPIVTPNYGPLDPKVDLSPDFFTGFDYRRRKEITEKEANFYHELMKPYSVDSKISKRYFKVPARDGFEIQVKEYKPLNSSGKLPSLLFIHGGGFVTCTIETHDYVPSYLAAKAGIAVFSVGYRLAPEWKYPVGIHDCYDVAVYLKKNADQLGIDHTDISVGGDSSGGNFSAVLCQLDREEKSVGFKKQVLIYPVTDVANKVPKKSLKTYAPDADPNEPGWYLKEYLPDVEKYAKDPFVSPIWADNFRGLPEALFIQAECDTLLDDGLIYANLLKQDGVPVSVHIYKGMPHAFILRNYKETFEALDTIVAFLK